MKYSKYHPLIIFLFNLVFYALFTYGGIRSPDSEVVFRTTESLVLRNEFAIPEAISWNQFGMGPGKDNKRYSIFGPAESILAVPLLKFAYFLKQNNVQVLDSSRIPLSFNVNSGSKNAGFYFMEGKRPPDIKGHFERFIVSFFNVLIGAISGVLFYLLILKITKSYTVSFFITFIYSFGSLIFSYTGTFFSEPLCTLFIILSFFFIIKNEDVLISLKQYNRNYFYSGLFLGLAITTHISAVLSVPFYYLFILGQNSSNKFNLKLFSRSSVYFTIGLSIFCILVLYYNYIRFGNILETGRNADPLYQYAITVNPLPGLYGFIFGAGKSLLIYSPIVLLSIIFWKHLHNKYQHLSITILGMIIVRMFFITCRSDWHGGFCLGPRYLIIIIPILFIPIALGIKEILLNRKFKKFVILSIFSFVCIAQQLFFSIGEIFSYFYITFFEQKKLGIEILVNNFTNPLLYSEWKYSPALYLLDYKTGPFILRNFSTNNYLLWGWMVLIFAIIFFTTSYFVYKHAIKDHNTRSLT